MKQVELFKKLAEAIFEVVGKEMKRLKREQQTQIDDLEERIETLERQRKKSK